MLELKFTTISHNAKTNMDYIVWPLTDNFTSKMGIELSVPVWMLTPSCCRGVGKMVWDLYLQIHECSCYFTYWRYVRELYLHFSIRSITIIGYCLFKPCFLQISSPNLLPKVKNDAHKRHTIRILIIKL